MKFESIPTYGDHMTMKHFIECVDEGGFIDYDGTGYYATKDKMSDKIIRPSTITGTREEFNMKTGKFKKVKVTEQLDLRFKYVVWFNK